MTNYMLSAALFILAVSGSSAFSSTLIPMRRHNFEHTYDPLRHRLYIPTKDGVLERYDIASNEFLEPISLGNDLRGSDTTPDGRFLYVTDYRKTGPYAELYKVDLDTLEHEIIDLPKDISGGTYDVTITLDGRAFTTGPYPGDGGLPISVLETVTDAWVDIHPANYPDNIVVVPASAARSADRSLAIFVSAGTIGGRVARYDALTGTYRSYKERISAWTLKGDVAVSRDGALIAIGSRVYQPDGTFVHEFLSSFWVGGLVFDPLQDLLYMAERHKDLIDVFDTNTWDLLGSLPVGEDIGAEFTPVPNFLSTSADARLLFVTTGSGVRMLENPFAVPEPRSALQLTILITLGMASFGIGFRSSDCGTCLCSSTSRLLPLCHRLLARSYRSVCLYEPWIF